MTTTESSAMIVPAGGLVLNCGVDVHKNRLEILYDSFGRGEECWSIEHVVLPGEIQDDSIWTGLGQELLRKFDHAFGCKIGLSFGFIDAGKWPDWVYRFLRRLAGFKAFNGDPLPGSPIRGKIRASRGWGAPASHKGVYPVINHNWTSIAGNLKGHWIGTDAAKGLIYDRAKLEVPEDGKNFPDGFMHFPMSMDEDFFKQLFAERPVLDDRGVRRFDQTGMKYRNEALDLKVMNLAAFRLLRIGASRFDEIEKDLKRQGEEAKKLKHGDVPVAWKKKKEQSNFLRRSGGFWNR